MRTSSEKPPVLARSCGRAIRVAIIDISTVVIVAPLATFPAVVAGVLLVIGAPVLLAVGAASEEDDDGSDQHEYHSCKTRPHSHIIISVVAAAVFVDVVLDDLKICQLVQKGESGMRRLTPKAANMMAMTTTVTTHAVRAIMMPTMLPKKPPKANMAAMKAKPQAIGARMKALVSPSELCVAAKSKLVPSTWLMIVAILYPISFLEHQS